MQRICPVEVLPEVYRDQNGHLEIQPEGQCPSCFKACRLHRHGTYKRWVTSSTGIAILILVARFLCPLCRASISCLPDFALSYRLVNARTLQSFIDGESQEVDVQRWYQVLLGYLRSIRRFLPTLNRVIGMALGWSLPLKEPIGPVIKKACGSFSAATRQLVLEFSITCFARYQCHQSPKRPKFIST